MSAQVQSWLKRQTRDFPIVTYSLIVFNVAVYIGTTIGERADIFEIHGLIPGRLSLSSMFTCAFLHMDLLHLALNMCFLWLFGRSVELAMGALEYLVFYVGSGFAASVTHVAIVYAFMPAEYIQLPVVGASGAISGILGVFTIRFFLKTFHFGRLTVPAAPFLLAWLVLQAIMGIMSLYHATYNVFDVTLRFRGVGYWSHFGGFVFGMLAASLTGMAKQGQKEHLLDDAREAMRRGTLLEVVRKFEWLLHYDPEDAFAAAELARTWGLLNDRDQSVSYYKRAIEMYLKRGEVKDAAERFDEMRRFWPDAMFDTESHFRMACLLEEAGEYRCATNALSQIYCYRPECSEAEMALLRSGHIELNHLDRPEIATAILEKFIEQYPKSEWRAFAEQSLARARSRLREPNEGHSEARQ